MKQASFDYAGPELHLEIDPPQRFRSALTMAFRVLSQPQAIPRRTMIGALVKIAAPPSRTEIAQIKGLVQELRIHTSAEVRFDDGSRALYATDASNYRQTPIGVVVPKDAEDVVQTVASCRRYGVPILSRGGGTSLAGQCCNAAVVIDYSKYLNRGLEIDRKRKLARVDPGCVLDDLRNQGEAGSPPLTFGPDPSTHDSCTFGGR